MSLESQVAALVEASNNLTGAVNNKIAEIDRKVDEATAEVPAAVVKTMNREIYVDALNGNDSAEGTSTSPVRTFNKALRMIPPGARGVINLKQGQVHEAYKDGTSGAEKTIIVAMWYNSGNGKPVLKCNPTSFTGQSQIASLFEGVSRVSVKFMDIEIATGVVSDPAVNHPYGGSVASKKNEGYGGLFSRGGVQNESIHFDIQFINCVIRQQHFKLFTFCYGYASITIARSQVIEEGVNAALCDSSVPKVLDISDSTFTGFVSGSTIKQIFRLTTNNHIIRENTNMDYDTGVSNVI